MQGIPDYSAQVRAHFHAPHNAGRFSSGSGLVFFGRAGSRRYGREVEFQIRATPDEHVAECRYRVYGCPATIALCSLASDMLRGRTLADVAGFSVLTLADQLGLPVEKRDAALTVEDAVRAAAMHYNDLQAPCTAARTG